MTRFAPICYGGSTGVFRGEFVIRSRYGMLNLCISISMCSIFACMHSYTLFRNLTNAHNQPTHQHTRTHTHTHSLTLTLSGLAESDPTNPELLDAKTDCATRRYPLNCAANAASNTFEGTLGWPCLQIHLADRAIHPLSWNGFVGTGIQDSPVPPAEIPSTRARHVQACTHTHTHARTQTRTYTYTLF